MILLSTVFTLLTTVWCCIRPDFPSYHDSKLRIFSTKLNIVFWVLICPEAVFLWAMRQWFEAGTVAKEFHYRRWTRRHGLFLLMGGFVLCDIDGKPIKTLSFQHFCRLLNQNVVNFPKLTLLDIQEQSNFHPAIAFVSLLQAIWFLMHCLSHFVNVGGSTRLPAITPLEALIATIVISCWCIFCFAWKKPLDARSSVLIEPTVDLENRAQRFWPTIDEVFESEQDQMSTENRFLLEYPPTHSVSIPGLVIIRTTRFLVSTLLWLPKRLYYDTEGFVPPERTYGSHEFPDGTLKIPLFYVQNTMAHRLFLLPVAFLSLGISVVSLLFAVPTSYHFSSPHAQLAWRVASIATTSFSASVLFFSIVSNLIYSFIPLSDFIYQSLFPLFDYPNSLTPFLVKVSDISLEMVFVILLIGFVPFFLARIVLLLLAVINVGFVPGQDIEGWTWADYIPHFC